MSKSGLAKDHLNSFIQRIERLEEEKSALAADIREVYSEAKGSGFDPKIMRKVIALRKMDAADRQEMEAMLDRYKSALGMLGDTPLGEAAMRAASPHKKKQTPHDPETGEVIEPSIVQKFGEAIAADHAAGKSAMGKSVPITEEEKEKGVVGAFEGKDGTRCTLAILSRAAPSTKEEMEIPTFLRRTKPPPELVE